MSFLDDFWPIIFLNHYSKPIIFLFLFLAKKEETRIEWEWEWLTFLRKRAKWVGLTLCLTLSFSFLLSFLSRSVLAQLKARSCIAVGISAYLSRTFRSTATISGDGVCFLMISPLLFLATSSSVFASLLLTIVVSEWDYEGEWVFLFWFEESELTWFEWVKVSKLWQVSVTVLKLLIFETSY